MVAKTIIAQFVLLAAFLLPSPGMAQTELRAIATPIGADRKPCIGIMFPPFLRDQKNPLARAERADQYKPIVYQDAATGTIFYLESDGQHLSAIGPGGKLLWIKSWNMCPYRVAVPHIVSVRYVGPGEAGPYDPVAEQKLPG